MKQLHAIIEGRVQGVGFREFVCQEARRLGLLGWVRNQSDGTLEVVAEGEDVALSHLVNLLEKGPALSRVEEVRSKYIRPSGEFTGFFIRR